MKILFALCLIHTIFFVSCTNTNEEKSFLKDWFAVHENSVAITDELTLDSLMNKLCKEGCESELGYTGDYSLKYDYLERRFNDVGFILELPFVGYKCKNSLIDMFFTPIDIEYYNRDSSIFSGRLLPNDSIVDFVQQHYKEIIYYGEPQPIINLKLQSNQAIKDLTGILYFVVTGYVEYQKQEVLNKLNIDISKEKLGDKDIKMFIKQAPLRIRIVPKDKDLYCDM